jgi:uncharacterized protein (TIGR02453 family)
LFAPIEVVNLHFSNFIEYNMLQKSTLDFIAELQENNNRDWFDVNRKRYQIAKTDMEQFADAIINELSHHDASLAMLTGKSCLFRINRDVRFSNDKSPYKTNMAFWMNKGGKKSSNAGYYVHIEPNGKSFFAGGVYMPMPPDLKKVRTEILYDFEEFKAIVENPTFKASFGTVEVEGHKTSRVPQGFDATHPSADYLKLKSYIASTSLSDIDLTKADLVETIIAGLSQTIPLVHFINRAFEAEEV